MIYGVFSDVHGNYEALKAALAFFKKNKATGFICCGDMTGYGPQPAECVKAVMGCRTVHSTGNHDAAVTGRMDMKWFNANAIAAILYARCKLSGRAVWLAACRKPSKPDFTLVHVPQETLTEYVLSEAQFTKTCRTGRLALLYRHSHMPVYFRQTEDFPPETDFLRPMRECCWGGSAA